MSRKTITVEDLVHHGYLKLNEEIYGKFKGNEYTAKIKEGSSILMNGKRYTSISIAAGTIRAQINGPAPDGLSYRRANGWTFWKRKNRNGILENLDVVRQAYMQGNK